MSYLNKLNIVVVNYNNSSCTIELLSSLKNRWHFINKCIIVDNASSENELDKLSPLIETNITLVRLNKNIGYFGGLNEGLKKLNDEDRLKCLTIIGNNDLLFNDSFFDMVFKIEIPSSAMAIAPSLLTKDGVYQNPAQVKKPSFFKRSFYNLYFSNYLLGSVIYKLWHVLGCSAQSKFNKDWQAKAIYIGMGAAYILLPSFFEKYRVLNYPYFLYGEEAFLSKQIEDANGIIWYEPSLEIIHLESVATAKMPNKEKYLLMKKSYKTYRNYFK